MDEYLNIRQKEIFHNLLANPADAGSAYANSLHELVQSYPQSGLLRALYGRALNDKNPAVAGANFDSRALHKLYYQPDNLLEVDASQVIWQQAGKEIADSEITEPVAEQQSSAEQQAPVDEETITSSITEEGRDEAATNELLKDQPLDFPEILNVSWMHSPEEEASREVAAEEKKEENEQLVDTNVTITPEEPAVSEAPEEVSKQQIEEPVTEPADQSEEELIAPAEVSDEPVTPAEALIEQEAAAPQLSAEDIIAAQYGEQVAAYQTQSSIEDEVFDEITGIDEIEFVQNPADLSNEPVAADEALIEREEEAPVAEQPTHSVAEAAEAQPVTDEAERLILGNIAATDYFVFDRAFGDKKPAAEAPVNEPAPVTEPEPQPAFVAMPQEQAPVSEDTTGVTEQAPHQDISMYHDEKMPYTFMWWLDKTRKEHIGLYQPYTKAPVSSPVSQGKKKEAIPDALQQQYFENIFHIASPVDELGTDASAQTIEFDMQSKGDRIIQRFITEDPHINPPVGEKLDTENKAKKSSEDNNEMVTETLARIYADQMLYPKAIATYKKLILKFPEKSRYFASRIENLEKKTN